MPKLIITKEGISIREFPLQMQRYVIGRRPDNDIFLDDQTVSSEHAAVTLAGEPAIVDLGSTNGTFVNGAQVSRHPLKHGDVVRVGQHELKYIDEQAQDLAATVVLGAASAEIGEARLHILSGPKAGASLEVTQERTPLGRPGGAVAVLLRTPEGYRLLAMGSGKLAAKVNGVSVDEKGRWLADDDVIVIGETQVRFNLV